MAERYRSDSVERIDGGDVRQSDGRREGASVAHPHQEPAVEQPSGDLDLDMDGRRMPHGGILEIHRHHSPAAQSRTQRKPEQQLAEGITQKRSAVLLKRDEEALVDQARESVFDGRAPNRHRPHERCRRPARRRSWRSIRSAGCGPGAGVWQQTAARPRRPSPSRNRTWVR